MTEPMATDETVSAALRWQSLHRSAGGGWDKTHIEMARRIVHEKTRADEAELLLTQIADMQARSEGLSQAYIDSCDGSQVGHPAVGPEEKPFDLHRELAQHEADRHGHWTPDAENEEPCEFTEPEEKTPGG